MIYTLWIVQKEISLNVYSYHAKAHIYTVIVVNIVFTKIATVYVLEYEMQTFFLPTTNYQGNSIYSVGRINDIDKSCVFF